MKTTLLSIGLACGLAMSLQAKDVLQLKTEASQERLLRGSDSEVVIKIDLTAGSPRILKRAPLNIAVVLDRSGSMSGAKIEKARQAAMGVVDQLGTKDIFSLIAYDTSAQVLIPAQTIEDREMVKRRIAQIQPAGSTALYDGVEKGAAQLERHLVDRNLNRVILLSDGLANVGPSSTPELAELGRRLARRGISISTVGLGDDYNEDLMSALAEASDANYYYVRDVEELPRIFAKELGQLLTVVARNVTIEVTCPEGVEPIGFMGRNELFQNGRARVTLSPFSSGQNRYLFLRCRVGEGKWHGLREVAQVRVEYLDETLEAKARSLNQNVKVGFTEDRNEARNSVNGAVMAQKELMLNALAKDEAIRDADCGNYKAASGKLKEQMSRLSNAAVYAPATEKQKFNDEISNLNARSMELEAGSMSKDARKVMQSESYRQKNAK